jgi:actin related protein 2/3 complex subunit 5
VVEVLNVLRSTDIPDIVRSLGTEQRDVLMKYIYAGMAKPEVFNSAVLLTWHEKVRKLPHTALFFLLHIHTLSLFLIS